MKTSFKTLLALAAVGASALISQAQTAPKILVLDIRKAFQSHYKAAEMDEALKGEQQKAQQEFSSKEKELVDLSEKIKALDEQTKNPALTKEAQAKIMADGEKMVQEFQGKQQELQAFANDARRKIGEKQQNITSLLVEDITKKGVEIGKKKGADLVLSKDTVIYTNPAWEITDEVIAEINKDKPAGAPAAKPAAAAPAPATKPAAQAPAAEGAPTIVFPGAKK